MTLKNMLHTMSCSITKSNKIWHYSIIIKPLPQRKVKKHITIAVSALLLTTNTLFSLKN